MFSETVAGILKHTAENPLYVVFPPAITTFAFEAAETISEYIRYLTGIAPVRTCETKVPDTSDALVIGDTALPENLEALKGLHYGECIVSAEKKRFILATYTDETLSPVIDSLIKNLTYEDGELSFMCDYPDAKYVLPGYISRMPHYDGGILAAYRRFSRGSVEVCISGTDAEAYNAYISKCRSENFFVVYENEIEGNLFTRLIFDDTSIYTYYTPFNNSVRIISEPVYNMHTDSDTPAKKICEPLMTVIGARFSTTNKYLNCDAGSGNMGYVFRLEDGRFLIVDGGMELGDYAEKILDTLREQRVVPGPAKIACWFLSHTHIDHTGAFLKIAGKYGSEVEIEEISANIPSISDAEAEREAWNIRRVSEAAYKVFPDAVYTKPHTGEIFRFGSTEVEILYTQDDLIRQYFSIQNNGFTWNTSSLCLRVNIAGNKIILPADCDEEANSILLRMYGHFLKSDILQVCHHGGWGGETEFYRNIDPELAIFSTSDELLPKYLQIKYNHDLVYDMNVIEVHNNADRSRTFELPYHPTEKIIPPDPKGEFLFTKAKQLEALASIENIRREQLHLN